MLLEKNCLECHCLFFLCRNPEQMYCKNKTCQQRRKNRWRQQKNQNDSDYKNNKAQANHRWQLKNTGYWRHYREQHPEYVALNRTQQQQRRQKNAMEVSPRVAKSDALTSFSLIQSGSCNLVPVVAKSDALHVKIEIFSMS